MATLMIQLSMETSIKLYVKLENLIFLMVDQGENHQLFSAL